ncbi:MAG: PDZ domain-containing protein [Planctomycetota bacterium]
MHQSAFLMLIAASIGWSTFASNTAAQQEKKKDSPKIKIELLNQDGERVKPNLEPPKPPAPGKQGQTNRFRVETKDGKVAIIDNEGNRQELNVEGAKSIIVTQSVQSSDVNGDKQTKRVGKAIIVGPDGQRQEIELGDGSGQFDWKGQELDLIIPEGRGVFRFNRNKNRFMIGVSCSPVSAAMTSQLNLESGVGLLVVNVDEESPAGQAGIELHDILMYADQNDLSSIEELVESVQEAGKTEVDINFTVLRRGKEQQIKVKPTERPDGIPMTLDLEPQMRFLPGGLDEGGFGMQFKDFGPGIIVQRQGNEIRDLHEQMQAQFKAQMEEMRRQMEQLRNDMKNQIDDN